MSERLRHVEPGELVVINTDVQIVLINPDDFTITGAMKRGDVALVVAIVWAHGQLWKLLLNHSAFGWSPSEMGV